MALIELKKCPHCGHNTWQEFVSLSPPASSYWRCRECGERREAPRVCVGDDAILHRARIQTQITCANVCIVDISRSGARLRFDPDFPLTLAVGDRVLFNAQLQPFGELSHYLPAVVRWEKGKECGIALERPLSMAMADIMCIIKN